MHSKPRVNHEAVAFDFDGVLSNSIHDSYRTSLNAYIRFRPDHSLPLRGPLVSAEDTFRFEAEHPDLFRRFRKILPLGNRAEDYCVMLTVLDRNESDRVAAQEDFDRYSRTIPGEAQNAYQRLFYEVRLELQDRDPEAWIKMVPAFPGMAEAVEALSKRFILAIATSKDRVSVDMLLRAYGIRQYFSPENILDKDFSESKRKHLARLHEMHGIPFGCIHFIDDKVLHLVSVKDLGVRCYLASWGFNGERERRIAEEAGFVVLKLEDLRNLEDG
jgi:phosphoglycolate phosphatase-like HAD superfamily hydrolase